MKDWFISTLLLIFFLSPLKAQNKVDKIISFSFENKPLIRVLYDLSEFHGVSFYFYEDDLPSYSLSGDFVDQPISKIVQTLINGTQLLTFPDKLGGMVIMQESNVNRQTVDELVQKWNTGQISYPVKNEAKRIQLSFGNGTDNQVSTQHVLKVSIKEEGSGNPLVGALLASKDFTVAESTNEKGYCSISLESGSHELEVSYTGFQSLIIELDIFKDANCELLLSVQSFLMDEIEIVANASEQRVGDLEAGKEVVSLEKLQNIPQLIGEADIIKSLEFLPGVSSTTELSQGFNVRGGGTDQNLILFDEGIIFNPTHIVGFISAFNPDVLGEATLYKGYVDASEGGRVAGVLDLKSTKLNADKWKGKGGLGTSLIKLFVEGPVNEKLNLAVGARTSYNDYLLKQIANVELQRSNARFYDLNLHAKYKLNANNTLRFDNYASNDFFEYNDEFGFKWSNAFTGLKLKSYWGNDLYSNISVSAGAYSSENFTVNTPDAFSFQTGLNYLKLKASANKKINTTGILKAGIEYIDYTNHEDKLSPNGNSTIQNQSIQRKGLQSIAPFFSYEQDFLDAFSFEAGLRYSILQSKGPGLVYQYINEEREEENITGFEEINGNDKAGNYNILEPRFTISYQPTDAWSLKSSYSRMSQGLFQLSTTNSALPSDVWVMADRYIKPSLMSQYTFGFVRNFDDQVGLNIDFFYKDLNQSYELKDFAAVVVNPHLETEVVESEGESYGFELLIDKNKGKWKGSLAYTYSRTFRQSLNSVGSLQKGVTFPAAFDIPHQVNLVASYHWLPVISFNFAYVYRSGRPITAPSSTIFQDGFVIPVYSSRNQERVPYYSRLDVSINMDLRKSKKDGIRSAFNLGFYNLLGRNNPSNVFFRRSAKGNVVPFQFAVIGAVIPNISWNFNF